MYRKLGQAWIEHHGRRQYKGVIFSPGMNIPGYYNIWGGFAVEPVDGDCQLFLEHIHQILCDGDDEIFLWVVAWMANCIQELQLKPGTAIVLRGKQGTGKSVFLPVFWGIVRSAL